MGFYTRHPHSWLSEAEQNEQTEALLDNRGEPVVPGHTVAYNLSGEVAVGEVVEVPADTRPYKRRIRIRLAHRAAGHPEGHVSRVNNEKSVLVL
jgi:hypothetical protein